MGNNQPRYYNIEDARRTIGSDNWNRIQRQLEKHRGKNMIDYEFFEKMLQNRFERMVRLLKFSEVREIFCIF